MAKSAKKTIQSCGGMVQYLAETNNPTWKKYHNDRTCNEAYQEIKKNLKQIHETVISGAMSDSIHTALTSYKEQLESISLEDDSETRTRRVQELFTSDPVVFLNDHGPDHIEKVIERANAIVSRFKNDPLSEFEVFLLLSAIQIHDIGNVLGRAGHEKKLGEIFDSNCCSIIPDVPERRVIKNIAMAHGGKSILGKDTISLLSTSEHIFNSLVRTRLLAAILRFADELADDSSRANRAAINLGILSTDSRIYHDYSRALHTVNLVEDLMNNDLKVSLVYELETEALKDTYQVGGCDKFLLDEIYDRTLKMEVERRYCMKFMHPYISIGRIDVSINIYGKTSERIQTISYTLEDVSYPETPMAGQIKAGWKIDVPSGEELLKTMIKRGVINDDK